MDFDKRTYLPKIISLLLFLFLLIIGVTVVMEVGLSAGYIILSEGVTRPWGFFLLYLGALSLTVVTFLFPKKPLTIISGILLTLLFLLIPTMVNWYSNYTGGLYPSLKDVSSIEAGPFITPGFEGHSRIMDHSLTIWWKSKSRILAKRFRYRSDKSREKWKYPAVRCDEHLRCSTTLTDLKEGEKYLYQVHALSTNSYTFTMPKLSGDAYILFRGDTGNTRKGKGTYSFQGEVNRAMENYCTWKNISPLLAIHGGDMVRYGNEIPSWKTFFKEETIASHYPSIYAAGNHEYFHDTCGNWRYAFQQPDYFAIASRDILIITLYPYDGYTERTDIHLTVGRKQMLFLEKTLSRSKEKWRIVVIHHPILSTGDYGFNPFLYRQLVPLLRKYHVDLVLTGHDHHFEAFHMEPEAADGGTLFIVSGTGGSHLDDYIMKRRRNRWMSWFQKSDSSYGLYTKNTMMKKYHRYGELSWGFSLIHVQGNRLTVTYQRWVSLPEIRELTSTEKKGWNMVPLEEKGYNTEKVFEIEKRK